jgi:hypothetical protein
MTASWQRIGKYTMVLWIDNRGFGVLYPEGNPDTGRIQWSFKFFDDGFERMTIGVYNYNEIDEVKREVSIMIRFRGDKMAEAVKKTIT